MKTICIGTRRIGPGEPCFFIAEAGTAHNGDLDRAQALVTAARRAGADCVKFQVVFADEIVHPLCGAIDLPGGSISLYERFKKLERDGTFYSRLKNMTEQAGLFFLATPFGLKSADLLRSLGVDAYKIASPELNHLPLLDRVSEFGRPVILSTGVSLLADIKQALRHVGKNVALLHCVTSYPAAEEEYNVRLIPFLSRRFGCPVGISDHSVDPVLVPAAGRIMGAGLIEKHITVSREADGLDDRFALTEDDFGCMVATVRDYESLGKKQAEKKLKNFFSDERVERVFGSGKKILAQCEAANYSTTRRSILATRDIPQGDLFSPDNIALLRSEKNLSPGLAPEYLSHILGEKAAHDIPSGKGIRKQDVALG